MTQALALYRKYRPQRFADVVGQESVVRTLRNAITQDRVAHAYLFTGSKGTGKTTMAKLLAKALNCEQGPTPDPCGVCESCIAIAEGRSMDVAEIDAASNRGIDDVREKIIDTVAYQPSNGMRRVYILDEAHQLTPSAFNALLKTIEEPPPHVLFAFCTTELHQMMPTVRDRCQRLALVPPGADQLLEVLRRVVATEDIEADDAALRAVARVAQGSFRNALGTLEMLATAFDRTFTHADVLAHLGAVSEDMLYAVADGVLAPNAGDVLRAVEQLVQEGADIEQFARELAEHFRTVLLVFHGVDPSGLAVGNVERLVQQSQGVDEKRVLAAIDCLSDAITRIRVGSDPRIAIETALVRACQGLGLPALALRLAVLEQQVTGGYGKELPQAAPAASVPAPAHQAPATPVAAQPARAPQPPATRPAPPTPAPAQAAARPAAASTPPVPAAPEPPAPVAAPKLDEVALNDVASWWPDLIAAASQDAPLRPVLAGLAPVGLEQNERLQVTSPHANMLTDKVTAVIRKRVLEVTGHKLAIDVKPLQAVTPTPAAIAQAHDEERPSLDEVEDAPTEPAAAPVGSGDNGLELLRSTFGATEL